MCKYRCEDTREGGGGGGGSAMHRCVYLVLGRKRLLVPGLGSRPSVKVKSDSKRDKADWRGNGICCLCAKRPD